MRRCRARTLMRDAFAALVQWQHASTRARCPPTTRRCCAGSLASFRMVRRPRVRDRMTDAQQAQWTAACDLLVASALAQPRVAVHRDFMPRNLMLAGTQPRHPRLPGRGVRPDHLRPGVDAARRVHLLGRGAGARLGGPLLAAGARRGPAGGRRLRRVLAPARVDGAAAPPQGAGHLLPPQASRRQAGLLPRPAALLRLRAPGRAALPGLVRCCALVDAVEGVQPKFGYTF